MVRYLLLAALLTPFASPAFAQATFDRDVGARVGTGLDDELVSNIALGHSFTFPDGTVTNAIDIDSNGRILLPSASNAWDWSPTIAEFVDGVPSICPRWDDLTPQGVSPPAAPQTSLVAGLYVKTNAFRTTITWLDTKKCCNSFPEYFTIQCQLFASTNAIAFVYDNRALADLRALTGTTYPVIVGVSVGTPGGVGGGIDPGESDLSAGLSTSVKTVYELFDDPAGFPDLRGVGLLFSPNTAGGYDVTLGPAGVTAGGAEKNGRPCPVSIDFFPDGINGYFVQRATPNFFDDAGMGTELAGPPVNLGDDSYTPAQQLGFTFTWPGGLQNTSCVIDNNGRVMADGTAPAANSWRPDVAEFLNFGATIAAFWTDLSSQRGSLRLFSDPSATPPFAAVTWEDVPQYAENPPHTFQVVLRGDGSFSLNYRDISQWQTTYGGNSDDVLIGCSPGGGAADPGMIDFAAVTNVPGQPVIYEMWLSDLVNGPNAREPEVPDIHTILTARNSPFVGGAMEVRMIGITAATASINLAIGFTNPNLDLGIFPFGLTGCTLLVDPIVTLPLTRDATDPSIADFRLGITTDPSQAGLPVIMQGINIAPTESPNPLMPLLLTNAVQGTVQL